MRRQGCARRARTASFVACVAIASTVVTAHRLLADSVAASAPDLTTQAPAAIDGGAESDGLDGGEPLAPSLAVEAGPASPPPAMARVDREPVVRASAAPAEPRRLPTFGVGADVGLPDGANASLVIRPVSFARFQLALGSNGIGRGYRIGAALLPMRDGPALVAEYGHYQDGDANAMAARLGVGDAQVRPLLERVGYDYANLHLALNFGYRRVVFFVQGGLSVVRGHIHNVAPFVHQQTTATATGSGSTEVVVQQDPAVRATGLAGKLGLIFYVW